MSKSASIWQRAWRWPLWLLSPFSVAHAFRGNPVLGSRLLNRCGLHVARLLLAHLVTRLRWLLLRPLIAPQLRRQFHRDGYLVLQPVLGEAEFAALRAELAGADGDIRECIQGDTLTQRLLLDDAALAELPVTRRLLADPVTGGILRYVAAKHCRPFHYLQRIRNRVRAGAPDPQKVLHADTFHPSMKAWLFLEAVTPDSGPFTIVPGSHRLSLARLRWEYRRSLRAADLQDGYSEKGSFRFEAEDLRELGLPAPQPFCVPANTLVIANTFGIHCRGEAAPGAVRRELWFYSRFNPFNPWPGIGLPWYSRADYALMKHWWKHLDRVAAARGGQSSWHPIAAAEFHAP